MTARRGAHVSGAHAFGAAVACVLTAVYLSSLIRLVAHFFRRLSENAGRQNDENIGEALSALISARARLRLSLETAFRGGPARHGNDLAYVYVILILWVVC